MAHMYSCNGGEISVLSRGWEVPQSSPGGFDSQYRRKYRQSVAHRLAHKGFTVRQLLDFCCCHQGRNIVNQSARRLITRSMGLMYRVIGSGRIFCAERSERFTIKSQCRSLAI